MIISVVKIILCFKYQIENHHMAKYNKICLKEKIEQKIILNHKMSNGKKMTVEKY